MAGLLRAVGKVGCFHFILLVVKRSYPNELPEFRWITRLLQQLENQASSGSFHALRFESNAIAYLGAFSYRFNRRVQSGAMTGVWLSCICSCSATARNAPTNS